MATKTTDKQQIHVVTDANFNHNKLINAKIDAKENEITNLPSGGNVDDVKVNNTSVVENKIASINLKTINRQSIVGSGNIDVEGGGSNLNEFVITQEIFDEYKNENDYADLTDIIDSEEITQNVINLNNFNYFLTGLVGSNKTLLFKNGTIVLGTSGINDSINNAITLSNSKLGFKDCEIIVNDSITTEPEKPIIDLNNTDLTFDNVIADNFTFTTFKTFIQTTNICNIVLKDTLFDIIDKLINYDPEEDEKRPSMKFIKVLTNGSSVKFINSMVDISTENLIGEDINPGLCQNIIVETIGLATVKLEILNSILQLRAEGGHGEGGISSRPPRCLDINLDNLDIILIDSLMSCFDSDGFNVRPESSYGLEPNKSFTTNDPYMVFFEPSIDIFQGDDEAEDYEPKFENINIDKYLFINTIEYIEGDYHFTYNGSSWDVTANSFDEDDTITRTLDTNITIEQIEEKYGLTFDLIEGKVLEQGDDITLELVLKSSYYKILESFTAESNSEEYFNELNYNIGEVTDLAEEIETVNYDNEKFANALIEVLERNGKHLKPHREYDEEQEIETDVMAKIGFWYDEDNGDPNVWKIEIDPEWIEEDRHLMDDVDLRDFGLEVIIKDGQEIHNLSGFTVVVEPKVESTTVSIKENTNSVITGNPFEEDFPWLENKQPLGMFSTELVGFSQVKSIQAENIKTNNISVSDEYYLPVDNENLESDNVKDAINELANKESNASSLFDIKTILTADAEANKGWACTCYDEPHKLNEEQVAQAYHEIENMLNQTVETKIEFTDNYNINGEDVDIKYYKSGEYKICTSEQDIININDDEYLVFGDLSNNNRVYSNFSEHNYIQLPDNLKTPSENRIFIVKFSTLDDVASGNQQCIFHSEDYLSIQLNHEGVLETYNYSTQEHITIDDDVQPNTDYWVKIIINGNNLEYLLSTDGSNFDSACTFTDHSLDEETIYRLTFGCNSRDHYDNFNGLIDFNEFKCYNNNELIYNGNTVNEVFAGSSSSNYDKLQDVYEYLGYLPYFWIDQENLDIVLPRNSNRWTMMYVGNNYVEEEMPEGKYSAFATKDELKNQPKIFQSDYYETVEILEQHDIEGDIVINKETYLSQVTDDWKDNIFTYNGSDWVDEEENVINLQDYGIDLSGTTYNEGSKFFVYSACLRNKDTYTIETHIDIISIYVNGIPQIKKRDYTIDENNVITFNNYTLKSTDSISVLGYNMEEGEE